MMIMIDPLSELCGLCVELLSTTMEPARPQRVLLVWMGEQRATCHICLLPNFTPQPASREARHISEHKRSVSVTLEIRSPWSARTTHQDWRRLRSRWSRGIFYRVLKDIVTVTYLQFQFINKICVLLFYLSKTVGPPQKIRKIYAISDFAFFFETPCRDFQQLVRVFFATGCL